MDEFVIGYIGFLQWLLLALIPAMVVLTVRTWMLARRYWPVRLHVIGAIISTIAGAACTWLGFTIIWTWNVGPAYDWFAPVTASCVVALSAVPFLMAGYLVWADPERAARERRPWESISLARIDARLPERRRFSGDNLGRRATD